MKQYQKLMEYDDVELEYTHDALEAVADRAVERGIAPVACGPFWRRS